jgi:hypothetical protein
LLLVVPEKTGMMVSLNNPDGNNPDGVEAIGLPNPCPRETPQFALRKARNIVQFLANNANVLS